MKKIMATILMAVLSLGTFVGCGASGGTFGSSSDGTNGGSSNSSSAFDSGKEISVISREGGSGTRGAFIELFEIEVKGADGSKKDLTTKEAVIAKQTDIMLTNVAGDKYTIGYVSLGSLKDTVKAVNIDGVQATTENVKNGSYKIRRPFLIATKGETNALAKDFINYILSADGQTVVSNQHYIAINSSSPAYAGSKPSGKIVVAGSSSVTPVMEKLREAYLAINSNATIEIQQSDSTAGLTAAIDGTCDIGMSSRDLKDSEKDKLTAEQIALDGIAVIVNKDNTAAANLAKEQVKAIFTGETIKWADVAK